MSFPPASINHLEEYNPHKVFIRIIILLGSHIGHREAGVEIAISPLIVIPSNQTFLGGLLNGSRYCSFIERQSVFARRCSEFFREIEFECVIIPF